jgi:hypothetical protein
MQHVYAAVFAGSITMLIAAFILYADYGFWHERYVRDDLTQVASTLEVATQKPESIGEMSSRFFGEAKERLQNIDTTGKDLLKGKETYKAEGS